MRRGEDWRRNRGLKVLSIALAVLLWSFVHGAKTVERELVLPLRCMNLSDSLALAADPPHEARVQVSGAAQDFVLRRFLPGAELRVDLARARPPVVRVTPTVTEVAMGGNSRLTVLRILEPGILDLPVERRAERRVPVRVVLAGEPAAGWRVHGEPRADPSHVACAGAASRIAALDAVATLPVDIGGREASLDARVRLESPATVVLLSPEMVSVHVELRPADVPEPGAGAASPAPPAIAHAGPAPD